MTLYDLNPFFSPQKTVVMVVTVTFGMFLGLGLV